jgi:hypothetical protein
MISDLDIDIDDGGEQLDVFKVEEIARAKIAKANYNSFLEKQKNETAPQTEEEEQDLAIGVISNNQRDFNPNSSKGDMKETIPMS